jgi:hypothetical protein
MPATANKAIPLRITGRSDWMVVKNMRRFEGKEW